MPNRRLKWTETLIDALRSGVVLLMATIFMVVSSGWVVHVHYCPVSTERIVSLNGPQECAEDMHQVVNSCCETEKASCDIPAPAKKDDCCEDLVLAFDLDSPFSYSSTQEVRAPEMPVSILPLEDFAGLGQIEPLPTAFERPPPEARRSLDRLTRLQVFRT